MALQIALSDCVVFNTGPFALLLQYQLGEKYFANFEIRFLVSELEDRTQRTDRRTDRQAATPLYGDCIQCVRVCRVLRT